MSCSNTGNKAKPAFPPLSVSHAIFTSSLYARYALVLGLLLHIRLRTTLLRLADIVSVLGSSLGLTVTSKASDGASNGASDTVSDTASEVVDLTLSFLALACSILLLTFMLQ